MKSKSTLRHTLLLAAGSALLAVSQSHADTITWDGDTSTTWATGGNWTGGVAPDNLLSGATADIANFNLATYGGNPVYAPNAGTTSINGITIGSSNGAMTLTTTTLSIGGSGITIANGAGALNVSGAVTIGAAQTWTNNDNDTATFGIINHNATATTKLTLAGSGKFLFNGVNTGKGGININSGTTLEIGSSGKLYGTYDSAPVVTIASGATLKANGWGWDTAGGLGQLFNSRTALVVNGGTIEYAGNSNSTGNATSQQNLTVGTGGATLKATTAGQTWTITLGDAQEFYNNLINNTGLTVGGAGNGVIHKHIIGTNTNGSLTKTDGGTWTLTGTNTYDGATNVSGGTLSINGNQSAAAGAVSVSALATLGGSGTVGGATSFAGTSVHAPGSAAATVGKQTFSSSVTYNSGSIFEWNLGSSPSETGRGTNYDAVNAASLGATSGAIFRVVLNDAQDFTDAFWDTTRIWSDIFKTGDAGSNLSIASIFTGAIQYYNVTNGALTGIPSTQGSFSITGTSLTWTAIPEPSTALGGLLLTAGLLRRRRSQGRPVLSLES